MRPQSRTKRSVSLCMSLSGSLEKYQQFLHDQPIMQSKRDTARKQFLHFRMEHDPNGSLFSCETGNSLTVLSQLGLFFQTRHLGNLFAACVALLRKRHETSASQQLTVSSRFQEHVSISHFHGSRRPHWMNIGIQDKDPHVYRCVVQYPQEIFNWSSAV